MFLCMQVTEKQAHDIAIKVADAVHYMHSQDPVIIHQDLKPQNILVRDSHALIPTLYR